MKINSFGWNIESRISYNSNSEEISVPVSAIMHQRLVLTDFYEGKSQNMPLYRRVVRVPCRICERAHRMTTWSNQMPYSSQFTRIESGRILIFNLQRFLAVSWRLLGICSALALNHKGFLMIFLSPCICTWPCPWPSRMPEGFKGYCWGLALGFVLLSFPQTNNTYFKN